MVTYNLTPDQLLVNMEVNNEIDYVYVPEGNEANSHIINSFNVLTDRIDFSDYPGITREEVLANAFGDPDGTFTRLSGRFGSMTLVGVSLPRLRELSDRLIVLNRTTANDPNVSTSEGGQVTIDVLANDVDPEGRAIELISFAELTDEGGTVTRNENGTPEDRTDDSLLYTPAAGFTGTDSFEYSISVGEEIESATVTVAVNPNNEPDAIEDSVTTRQGDPPVDIDVLSNDFDLNGDDIVLTAFDQETDNGGTITLNDNGTPQDGGDDTLIYTPAAGFLGTDSFGYSISDGEFTDTATVTVEVIEPENQPPIARSDVASTSRDSQVNIFVLDNDFDPNGTSVSLLSFDTLTGAGGTVSLADNDTESDSTDDYLVYTPRSGFTGTDNFTYTISDGELTAAGTVNVTVVPPANQPPLALDDTVTATEGTPETIAVLDNDSDPDGDEISIVGFSATTTEGGTVTIDNGGTPFNPTDDTLVYSAAADFTGTDSFTYTISDRNGDVSLTDTATVTVRVERGNVAPVATDDTATATEGTPETIAVLDNDSDPNGDEISLAGFPTRTREGGTITLDRNGTFLLTADDSLVYTPASGFTGNDSFTYTISDGELTDTATVIVGIVTVEPVPEPNEAPIAADDAATTTEGTPEAIAVLDNDFDMDGDQLTIEGVSQATAAGGAVSIFGVTLIYTPPAVETGGTLADSFTYTISDGDLTDTATVTVTVQAENEPPISVDDVIVTTEGIAATISVLDNDSDPENAPLRIEGLSGTAIGGTVSLDGETVIYTPPAVDALVTDNFTYRISDGELTDTATVTVTVEPDNQPPIAQDEAATTTEGIAVTIAVLDNDSDPDNDPLEITSVTDPANGTTIIDENGTPDDPTDDRILYTPDAGFNGTHDVTYSITDGRGGTASATVTVIVEANEAPIAVADARIIAADTPINITVLDNDSDPDDALTINGVTDPANGTASVDGALVSYTPDAGFTGDDSFTYTISDPAGATGTAVVSINVQPAGQLIGTDGDDWIVGNNMLSIALGGRGIRERIDGAAGNDTITGALGADILSGGEDADRFVYLDLADSGANPAATNEGVDDILDFNPAEDTIGLNFDVAPGTPVTLDDVQINLDFIEDGTALIGLSTPNTEPDLLPEQFAIRLSGLDAATTAAQIQNALIF